MKNINEFSQIFLCTEFVDFRKGIASLAAFVEQRMDCPVFSGALFLFTNKKRNTLKALYWDKTGFALWIKALEKEKFPWQKNSDSISYSLDPKQLDFLLSGINPWKIKKHKDLFYKKTA